jgi:hypothetical protein
MKLVAVADYKRILIARKRWNSFVSPWPGKACEWPGIRMLNLKTYENFLPPIAGCRGVRVGRWLIRVRERQRIKAKQD